MLVNLLTYQTHQGKSCSGYQNLQNIVMLQNTIQITSSFFNSFLAYASQYTSKGSPTEFWEVTQVKSCYQQAICRDPTFLMSLREFVSMEQVCPYPWGSAGLANSAAGPLADAGLWMPPIPRLWGSYLTSAHAVNALMHFLGRTNAGVWDYLCVYCSTLPSPDVNEPPVQRVFKIVFILLCGISEHVFTE